MFFVLWFCVSHPFSSSSIIGEYRLYNSLTRCHSCKLSDSLLLALFWKSFTASSFSVLSSHFCILLRILFNPVNPIVASISCAFIFCLSVFFALRLSCPSGCKLMAFSSFIRLSISFLSESQLPEHPFQTENRDEIYWLSEWSPDRKIQGIIKRFQPQDVSGLQSGWIW